MQPTVSVIMPVYDAQAFLPQAIDSVLSQSFQDMELIIVDDCSTDASLQVALGYQEKDGRVKVLAQEQNQGVAAARNRGIAQARGKYIALLDSDDLWLKDKLRRQVELIEREQAQIAYCSYALIDQKGRDLGRPFIVPERTDFKGMLAKSVMSCSTVLIQADLLKAHPFRSDQYHEDYVLWMELLSIPVKAVGDPQVLARYRHVYKVYTKSKLRSAIERWRIYRNVLGMELTDSVRAFIRYAAAGIYKYYLSGPAPGDSG